MAENPTGPIKQAAFEAALPEGYTMKLACCESVLLREIAMPEMKRRDIAKTYRLAMESSERGTIDWGKVNRAIIERWSRSGLEWIKKAAWSGRCFKGPAD